MDGMSDFIRHCPFVHRPSSIVHRTAEGDTDLENFILSAPVPPPIPRGTAWCRHFFQQQPADRPRIFQAPRRQAREQRIQERETQSARHSVQFQFQLLMTTSLSQAQNGQLHKSRKTQNQGRCSPASRINRTSLRQQSQQHTVARYRGCFCFGITMLARHSKRCWECPEFNC